MAAIGAFLSERSRVAQQAAAKTVMPHAPEYDTQCVQYHIIHQRTAVHSFVKRTGLAEAGVDFDALVQGASLAINMATAYVAYLLIAFAFAIEVTTDVILPQPQANPMTIFSQTWHQSLSSLSHSDIANLWRLADYLQMDADSLHVLEDVAVQHQARCGVPDRLLEAVAHGNSCSVMLARVHRRLDDIKTIIDDVWQTGGDNAVDCARGLAVSHQLVAARFGHYALLRNEGYLDNLGRHQYEEPLLVAAAEGGHLRLVEEMIRRGAHAGPNFLFKVALAGQSAVAIWAVINNIQARPFTKFVTYAVKGGCVELLQWLYNTGRVTLDGLRQARGRSRSLRLPGSLKKVLSREKRAELDAFLDAILPR